MDVPKVIHQLWIGDKNPPTNALNKVRDMNPHCEYVFWNEEKLNNDLVLPDGYLKKIETHIAINGKADMYRYLILLQYGGVWVDADILPIEPISECMFKKPFFCWENETARPGLCANSILGFTKNHLYMKSLVHWILDNETREKEAQTASWDLVGPGLLTRLYQSATKEEQDLVNVYPSYYFLPDHYTGMKYKGHGKVFTTHEWGTTWNQYEKINTMDLPKHHKKPTQSITIDISGCQGQNESDALESVKNIQGHFIINLKTKKDISEWLLSTRFITQLK